MLTFPTCVCVTQGPIIIHKKLSDTVISFCFQAAQSQQPLLSASAIRAAHSAAAATCSRLHVGEAWEPPWRPGSRGVEQSCLPRSGWRGKHCGLISPAMQCRSVGTEEAGAVLCDALSSLLEFTTKTIMSLTSDYKKNDSFSMIKKTASAFFHTLLFISSQKRGCCEKVREVDDDGVAFHFYSDRTPVCVFVCRWQLKG